MKLTSNIKSLTTAIFISTWLWYASNALANNMEPNYTTQQNITQNDIDKQVEAYYQRLITTPWYEYTDLFKKLWKEKKEGWLWNDVYKRCVEVMAKWQPPERLAMDVLIIAFGQWKINKDIKDKIEKRLAEKKTDIYFMKQIQRIIQLSIQNMEEKAKLAEVKELNIQLQSILESLEWMNKLFKEKQSK